MRSRPRSPSRRARRWAMKPSPLRTRKDSGCGLPTRWSKRATSWTTHGRRSVSGRRGGNVTQWQRLAGRSRRGRWACRNVFWHTHHLAEAAHHRYHFSHGPAGSLPDSRNHRRRRDGLRVQGLRSRDQPAAGDQAAQGAAAPRRRVPRALPARGEGRRRAFAPEHRDGVRRRRRPGPSVHRDGARRGADARRGAEGEASRCRPRTSSRSASS